MKKLKKSVLVMLVGVLSAGLVGCATTENEGSQTQLEQIKEEGVLTIATSADYPPYEFHKDIDGKDTIVGFDIMIAQEIAKELGVELEITDMKFDGLLGALSADKADMVLAGMTPTQERKNAVNFTDVYYEGESVIVIKKENKETLKTVEDLKKATISVQKSSLQESIAIDALQSEDIKGLSKIPDVVLEVVNDNADAAVVSKNAMTGYLKQYPELSILDIELEALNAEGSAIALKKSDDTSLVDETNKILNNLIDTGKVDEFVEEATELAQ